MQKALELENAPQVIPAFKRQGRITAVLTTEGKGQWDFPTHEAGVLAVDHQGIEGNRHRGWTRGADSRVPYLKRGTVIRNTRHLSLVSSEDLAEIASRLDVPRVDGRWIGANLVIEGIERLSFLPRGTRLFSEGGAILIIEDQNAPCRFAGKTVADSCEGRPDIELEFPKVAKGLRGLVASVEHPGTIGAGTSIEARIPAQWIYR